MVDHNALVTDTHPLVFHVAGGRSRLGAQAAAHFDACDRQEAMVYVPAAVLWECCCLDYVGKIKLKRSPKVFFETLFENPCYLPLDLTPEQVFLSHEFRPNRDPFDALICGAARSLDLPLLTRDTAITDSGMDVVW